ncbi:hypothetical protein V2A60_003883 [Cordyceps javanica]
MALGAWCANDADSALDDQLYHRALSFSEDRSLFGGADLTFVQALVLLGNLVQKRNKPNTGSNFLGLAVRMAISLGLHRELPNWKIGPLQREIRRRVWWGLYMFDSGASTTFGRPILLPGEEAMDVYPVRNIHDKDLTDTTEIPPVEWDGPTLYSGMRHQSRLHVKSNFISNRLLSSSGVSPEEALMMNGTLDEWCDSLPRYMRLDGDDDQMSAEPGFYFNRARLWWRFWNLKIIVFREVLLRRAVERRRGHVLGLPNGVNEQCSAIAMSAASATIESIEKYTKHHEITALVTWYSIYFTFHASLIVGLAIIGDKEALESTKRHQEFKTARHIFRDVFAGNQFAGRCADILDIIVPEQIVTTEDWLNMQPDASFLDFSTWPESANEAFNTFDWPDFDYMPE